MRMLIAAAAAAGLAILAGCSPADKGQVRQEVQGVRQTLDRATDDAQRAAANATLAGKVKAALSTRKGIESRGIKVEARSGSVVLKGDVRSPDEAQLAERVAMDTEGVQHVDNQLTMRVPAKLEPQADMGPR